MPSKIRIINIKREDLLLIRSEYEGESVLCEYPNGGAKDISRLNELSVLGRARSAE